MGKEVLNELARIRLPKSFEPNQLESAGKRKVLLDISQKEDLKKMIYLAWMLTKRVHYLDETLHEDICEDDFFETCSEKSEIEDQITAVRDFFWERVNKMIPKEVNKILIPYNLMLTKEWKVVGDYGMRIVFNIGDCN